MVPGMMEGGVPCPPMPAPYSPLSEAGVGLPSTPWTSGRLLHLHVVATALAMPGLLLRWVMQGGIPPAPCPSLSVLVGSGAFSGWWFCACALFQTVDAWAAVVP